MDTLVAAVVAIAVLSGCDANAPTYVPSMDGSSGDGGPGNGISSDARPVQGVDSGQPHADVTAHETSQVDAAPDAAADVTGDAVLPDLSGSEAASPEVQCQATRDGLLAWWEMEDNAMDSVGGNHGTAGNGIFVTGRAGRGFDTRGSGSIELSPIGALNTGTGDFTVSMWLWFRVVDNLGGHALYNRGGGMYPDDHSMSMEVFPNSWRFMIRATTRNENDLYVYRAPATSLWTHLAAVRRGDTLSIYIDGELAGTQTTGTGIDTGEAAIARMGRLASDGPANWQRHVNAILDEVRVYSRALTEPEIGSLTRCFQ